MPRETSEATKKDLAYLRLKNLILEEVEKIEDFNFKEFIKYLQYYFK